MVLSWILLASMVAIAANACIPVIASATAVIKGTDRVMSLVIMVASHHFWIICLAEIDGLCTTQETVSRLFIFPGMKVYLTSGAIHAKRI
jgi:hypothetical protein